MPVSIGYSWMNGPAGWPGLPTEKLVVERKKERKSEGRKEGFLQELSYVVLLM